MKQRTEPADSKQRHRLGENKEAEVGRFRAESVIVREANEIRVVFYNHESIYVHDLAHDTWVIFHRWFRPIGSYNNGWRQFRHLLLYVKNLDMAHCYRLARRWDIQSCRAKAPPDLSKFKVQERRWHRWYPNNTES